MDEEATQWPSSRKRRELPGTSLGTGAMSHLSYYSHSPRPDLRQTNNLSPTAATVLRLEMGSNTSQAGSEPSVRGFEPFPMSTPYFESV